jgi:hypothetical protein
MRRLLLLCVLLCAGVIYTAAQDDDIMPDSVYHTTHHRADGSRLVEGRGTFPSVRVVDLPLEGEPLWLVGAVTDADNPSTPPIWAVIYADGSLQGTYPDETGTMAITPLLADYLPPGAPPVLAVNDFGAFLDDDIPADSSPLTHSVRVPGRTVYISGTGEIVLTNDEGAQIVRLPLGALPDARIVVNSAYQAAIYAGATDGRYVHGVLGDDLEAAALVVLNLDDGHAPVIVGLVGDEVFEGLSPIWADVTGDGLEDLVTTVSSAASGAQIRVYSAVTGDLIASGPAVGQAGRWRHQLAWGAFGPNGESELVEVLTPHIGGVVGFYRYDGAGGLNLVAQFDGYTSHVIGSRNLDMAVAGDFNGDGQPEIALPDQEMTRIAGLQHSAEGEITEVWSLPLDGLLVTNLSAVTLPDGRLALSAGVESGGAYRLRIWLPG